MKMPFRSRAKNYIIDRLRADDAEPVAAIHGEHFRRAWMPEEFEALLVQSGVFGFAAREIGNAPAGPAGFVLARTAADEAEILTIAVARSAQRHGLGRDLMEAVLRALYAERIDRLFLEVDEVNAGAIALYKRLRFYEVGRRPTYYDKGEGGRSAALIMRRDLVEPPRDPSAAAGR